MLPIRQEEVSAGTLGNLPTVRFMKWESEDEMNEGLRRIAREMRQLREELRSQTPGDTRYRSAPVLPTDGERRPRPLDDDESIPPSK